MDLIDSDVNILFSQNVILAKICVYEFIIANPAVHAFQRFLYDGITEI